MTHTFATLEVSPEVYDEIAVKLEAAGYSHLFFGSYINMHGIALDRSAGSSHQQEIERLKAAFEARVTELLAANNAEWLKRIYDTSQVHDLERRLEMAEHALETVLGLANDRSDPGKDTRQAVIEVAEDALAERRQQLCVDPLASLVGRFALALLKKLRMVEQKRGFGDAWAIPDWHGDLVQSLFMCVHKGDPIDVAAYAAFAWHHGWTTTPAPDWQPIASAPRDGSQIELGGPSGHIAPNDWHVETGHWRQGTHFGWWENDAGDAFPNGWPEPTYWRPRGARPAIIGVEV
ncbi:hypothetical protein V5F77_04185 [Xanthobacter sp. DSM 24535]|uniref:hypothetical protein n=1 Tax=Roseixanthobacter psychrophilus TaxID=3119917 RepID=UPI003729CFCE